MNQQRTNNRGWETGLFAEVSVAVIVAITSVHSFLSINQLPMVA
jgi:hypothetical protein